MPPQPLSRVSPNPEIRIGKNAFKHAPEASSYITEIISTWSLIETRITVGIAQMMKTDYEAAAAMYDALVSGPAKRAALLALSAHTLPGPSYCLLQAVLKVTKPSRDKRNDFAHHVWGYAKNIPDALLLFPPSTIVALEVDSRRYAESGLQPKIILTEGRQVNIANSRPTFDHDNIAVWRVKDLAIEAAAARRADDYFAHLWVAISDSPVREQRRKMLFDVPAIDQAFELLSHQNDQSSHLRQHRQKPSSPV